MKTLLVLALLISSLPLIAQDTGTNAAPQVQQAPPIPEEARKHFVMGTALFKDAKTPDDYTQVVGEFKQAADLAPQWPDARYNLALAKEAAGDYSGAEADLKLYQHFKLSADEARTVQDKIYVIEAKQEKIEKAAKKQAQDAAQEHAAAADQSKLQETVHFFSGDWNYTTYSSIYENLGSVAHGHGTVHVTTNGRIIEIDFGSGWLIHFTGTIQNDNISTKWVVNASHPTLNPEDNPPKDFPIDVTVDRAGNRIYWKSPWPGAGPNGGYWKYDYYMTVDLTK